LTPTQRRVQSAPIACLFLIVIRAITHLSFKSSASRTISTRCVCHLTHLICSSLLILAASRHSSARTAVRLRALSATISTTSQSLSSSQLSRQRTIDHSHQPIYAQLFKAQVLSHTSQTQSYLSLTYSCVRLLHQLLQTFSRRRVRPATYVSLKLNQRLYVSAYASIRARHLLQLLKRLISLRRGQR
jgi:hypothetical protein